MISTLLALKPAATSDQILCPSSIKHHIIMKTPALRSRPHLALVAAFQFVAGILFVVSVMSIAVLINWYAEKSDRPAPLSMAVYSAGCISILLNLTVAFMSFDGLQRSILTTEIFASQVVLLAFGAVLTVEVLQVYFYHAVTRPHQLYSVSGELIFAQMAFQTDNLFDLIAGESGRDFSDWLHWAVAAFTGPIVKMVLILTYSKCVDSQDRCIKAHLEVDIQ
jgi:hypothetical protein